MPRKAEKAQPVSSPPIRDTRGGRPTYSDHRRLATKVNDYFKECEDAGVFPDEKGMYVYLGVFKEDIEQYLDDSNPKADEYVRILKLAQYRRESWLARNMVADVKMACGCMNALKQEQNGGYTDRPVVDKKQRVEIVLPDGATMELFK